MNVLILGAAGRTGRELVSQALAAGHEVTAFVRSAEHLEAHKGLKIVIGDAENAEQIAGAAAGHEAVISALGHTTFKASTPLTSAMQALVKVLPAGTKVISLTGFGVPDPNDPKPKLGGRLLTLMIKLLPGGVFGDGERHVEVLRRSQLNWTVIRAAVLTSGPAQGYELGYFNLSARDTIARADVAAAMVACLTTDQWSHQAPMIRRA